MPPRPSRCQVTVYPGQDVLLPLGVSLDTVRPALARATGRPELTAAPLVVDDRPLDPHHVVGQPPLVAGAVVRTARVPRPLAEQALEQALHVAILDGPGCGRLVPLPPRARRGSPVTTLPGLEVAVGPGRRGHRVRVRACGGARARLHGRRGPAGRGRPLVGWTRWRPGRTLEVDDGLGTLLELRTTPPPGTATRTALAPRTRGPAGPRVPVQAVVLTVVALGAVGLAVALRNPMIGLSALTGPLVIGLPLLLRRRRAGAAGPGSGDESAALDRRSPSTSTDPAGPHPADLLTAAVLAATGSGAPPLRGSRAAPVAQEDDDGSDPLADPFDVPGRSVAVVGSRAAALGLAARVVLAQHASGRRVSILSDGSQSDDWRWTRWLPGCTHGAPGPTPPSADLVVVDGTAGPRVAPWLRSWHTTSPGAPSHAAGPTAPVLLVVPTRADVPSWCVSTVDVDTPGPAARRVLRRPDAVAAGQDGGTGRAGAARATWSCPGRPPATHPVHMPGRDWLEEYARRTAALHADHRWPLVAGRNQDGSALRGGHGDVAAPGAPGRSDVLTASGTLPAAAALQDVVDLSDLTARWSSSDAGTASLAVPLGAGSDGRPVVVDLVTDGPHALVAGTTGAGKSELLQTLVLSLALVRSPADLSVALVDYKGGASLGPCADLPHVVGLVTDLDPGAAGRALAGLRAELRRRERLFAEVGATTLEEHRERSTTRLPRLLVVVDELRAMTDDQPELVPGLVRIAAQGRSLGFHLVLATQRPSGAITADMRANIALRVALRVVDTADSSDVLGTPDAAWLPADVPGRALLRRGLAEPEAVQVYHAGGRPGSGPDVTVLPCPPWGAQHRQPVPASPRTLLGSAQTLLASPQTLLASPQTLLGSHRAAAAGLPAVEVTETVDPVRRLVDAARAAARSLELPRPHVPWAPDLPSQVTLAALSGHGTAPGSASTGRHHDGPDGLRLPLALADHPADQSHQTWSWHPRDGHLLVLGRAGSGRTTALRTLALSGLTAGLTVHAVGPPGTTAGIPGDHPGLGTCVPHDAPQRVARLLSALRDETADGCHLLLVDGLDELLPVLAPMGRGSGVDLLVSVLRSARAAGVAVAATSSGPAPGALAALLTRRVVLSSRDVTDDQLLGVPRRLAGLGGVPGRAVVLDGPRSVRCQVAGPTDADAAAVDAAVSGARRAPAGPQIVPVPRTVRRADLAPVTSRTPTDDPVLLGLGGDDAGPRGLVYGRDALVCGPPGSGRSTVLAQVLADARVRRALVGVVSVSDSLMVTAHGCVDDVPVLTRLAPADVSTFVAAATDRAQVLATTGTGTGTSTSTSSVKVARVVVVDDLDALLLAAPQAGDALAALTEAGVVLVASATTAATVSAYRGPLHTLRTRRHGVVLEPTSHGSGDALGTDLSWAVEPDVHQPGRGVLVRDRRCEVLQVASEEVASGRGTPERSRPGRSGPDGQAGASRSVLVERVRPTAGEA